MLVVVLFGGVEQFYSHGHLLSPDTALTTVLDLGCGLWLFHILIFT